MVTTKAKNIFCADWRGWALTFRLKIDWIKSVSLK
jgi:hypothetical protein